jgi:hypothetical protein
VDIDARIDAALAALEANARRIAVLEMALVVTGSRRSDVPPAVLLDLWANTPTSTYRRRALLVSLALVERGYKPVHIESIERRMRRYRRVGGH